MDSDVESLATPDIAATRDNSELFAKALELAPRFDSLATISRAVNDVLDLDLSAAAWRGLFNRNDADRERIRKRLGVDIIADRRQRVAVIDGNIRGVVTNDVHVPFHDTNPARIYRLQDEIDMWHVDVVAPFTGVSRRARKYYLPGNHEDRQRRYLWRHPELFGIRALELPNLLELDRLGIEYAEHAVKFGTLLEVSHGTRVSKWSGMSAKAEQELRRYSISTITGHVHRMGRFQTHTDHADRIGQENGCLCSLFPEYMHNADWVHGITFFEIKDGALKIEPIQFSRDYTAIYGGKVYSA